MSLFKEPRFLLPGVDFTVLMNENVSDKTKKTIWKYLQLILFSVVEQVDTKESFGDTSKVFEAIKEEDLHKKIMETMDEMKNLFGTDFSGNMDMSGDFMDSEKIKSHLDGLMNGKIGNLAKEIATEIDPATLNFDPENPQAVLQSLLSGENTNLMSLVQNISGKIQNKMESGQIDQQALFSEAASIMNNLQNMPGMAGMPNNMGAGGFDPNMMMGMISNMMLGNNKKKDNTKNLTLLPKNHPKRRGGGK